MNAIARFTRRVRGGIRLVAPVVLLSFTAAPLHGQTTWAPTTIGSVAGIAFGVSDHGQVVGYSLLDGFVVGDLDGGGKADIALDFNTHGVWMH